MMVTFITWKMAEAIMKTITIEVTIEFNAQFLLTLKCILRLYEQTNVTSFTITTLTMIIKQKES